MRHTSSILAIAFVGAAALLATSAGACTGPPPTPPPRFWVQYHGYDAGDNADKFWVGQEVSLFPPPAPVVCACGLVLYNTPPYIPPGAMRIKDVGVFIVNRLTHQMQRTPFFTFDPNPNTSAGIAALAPPGGNALGFAGHVQPFNPDTLQFPFVYKLLFLLNVPRAPNGQPFNQNGFIVNGLIGAGLGDPEGFPMQSEFHLFNPTDDGLNIPAPGAIAMIGAACVLNLRGRR